jgi:PGF-CTERM protein
MADHAPETAGHGQPLVSRRTTLQAAAGIGLAGIVGSTPVAAQSSGGDIDWEFDTGAAVHSSPTVVGSFVYVGNDDGSVYALNASNAYERWEFETNGSVRSSPLVVDGLVFVGSNDNSLYGIDAESGEEVWTFETGGAVVSSPVVVDKTVYVGSRDGSLYAINAETGRQSWAYETGGQIDGSPVVVNGTVYIGSADGTLYALAADSGEEVWRFETGGEIQTSPTVANELVYVSSEDSNVYAIGIESGEEQWSESLYRNGGLTAPTVAEGAYSRDTLFVADNVRVHALNAAVGGPRWSTRFDGSDPVAPTVINNHVVAGDDNAVALDAKTGDELWNNGDGVTSAPTGADDTVFLGGGDSVYALVSGTGGASEDSRVTLGTLGHHDGWRYADQTLEIDTTPPEEEQTETAESAEGNETDTDTDEPTEQSGDDEESTESSETGTNAPGFGIGTTIAAVSGASYLLRRRLGGDRDD